MTPQNYFGSHAEYEECVGVKYANRRSAVPLQRYKMTDFSLDLGLWLSVIYEPKPRCVLHGERPTKSRPRFHASWCNLVALPPSTGLLSNSFLMAALSFSAVLPCGPQNLVLTSFGQVMMSSWEDTNVCFAVTETIIYELKVFIANKLVHQVSDSINICTSVTNRTKPTFLHWTLPGRVDRGSWPDWIHSLLELDVTLDLWLRLPFTQTQLQIQEPQRFTAFGANSPR